MPLADAPATYALIAVTSIVSLYALYGDRGFREQFAFQVRAVAEKHQNYRVITSSFLHSGAAHLLLNMMTLFFFGPTVEAELGTLGFLVVYFGAIVASGVISVIVNRKNPLYASLGASDAVAGVVLSFCCFHPFSNIYLLLIPIGIPAILFGGLFILLSARLMDRPNRVIAHEGHLGGALAGAALTILMKPEIITGLFA